MPWPDQPQRLQEHPGSAGDARPQLLSGTPHRPAQSNGLLTGGGSSAEEELLLLLCKKVSIQI